jgi:drug/metabolite transporter (DMT)-like permease
VRTSLAGFLFGAFGMSIVGGSFAVSDALTRYPISAGQAARYLLGAALLLMWTRLRRQKVRRPTSQESVQLVLLAATGLAGFNACLVLALQHAEPAVLGVVVGASPIVLALLPPLIAKRRPQRSLVVAASLVVIGVVLVEGAGHASVFGLILALGALVGEVSFTLLAVPMLKRLEPVGVSVYTCLYAALLLIIAAPVVAFVTDTPAVQMPTRSELAAITYLGVMVTAVAFVAWYTSVSRLGSERAGLLGGLLPVSALVAGVVLGVGEVTPIAMVGTMVVGVGVMVGVVVGSARRESGPPSQPELTEGRVRERSSVSACSG